MTIILVSLYSVFNVLGRVKNGSSKSLLPGISFQDLYPIMLNVDPSTEINCVFINVCWYDQVLNQINQIKWWFIGELILCTSGIVI